LLLLVSRIAFAKYPVYTLIYLLEIFVTALPGPGILYRGIATNLAAVNKQCIALNQFQLNAKPSTLFEHLSQGGFIVSSELRDGFVVRL
jgi:hypothetical protein